MGHEYHTARRPRRGRSFDLRFHFATAASTALGILASTLAFADDVPPQWTGLYMGLGVTGSHLETDQYSPAQLGFSGYQAATYGGTHFYGFVQGGADLQLGKAVLGLRLRHEMTGSDGDHFLKVDEVVSSNAVAITTLSARIGYLLQPRILVYANAGPAFGQFNYSSVDERWNLVDASLDASRVGVAVGAGAEYRLSEHVSMFAEYTHTNFSKDSSTFNHGDAYPANWTYEFKHRLDSVQMGMNIRF
jgi:opacity protein-like surface antigen